MADVEQRLSLRLEQDAARTNSPANPGIEAAIKAAVTDVERRLSSRLRRHSERHDIIQGISHETSGRVAELSNERRSNV